MEKNCVIIPTHPQHYAEAHANLLSMLRFATDTVEGAVCELCP